MVTYSANMKGDKERLVVKLKQVVKKKARSFSLHTQWETSSQVRVRHPATAHRYNPLGSKCAEKKTIPTFKYMSLLHTYITYLEKYIVYL